MWSQSQGLNTGQKAAYLRTQPSACWASLQRSGARPGKEAGGRVGQQQPVPCGAHGLVLAPDLNTGLGDGDTGGPGLPVMS